MTAPPAIVGIDLGAASSRVAVYAEGGARIVEDADGRRAIPSAVVTAADGARLVGVEAARAALVRGATAAAPVEAAAALIEALAAAASAELGAPVTRAVVAVPAEWDDHRRKALRAAGRSVGVEVVRLIHASSAAALAAAAGRRDARTIAVADVGAATTEIAIVRCEPGLVEVLGRASDAELGGRVFDERVAALIRDELQESVGVDVAADAVAAGRLAIEAEAARRALSRHPRTSVIVPNLVLGDSGPISLARPITAEELEGATEDLVARVAATARAALAEAAPQGGAIDAVVAAGGLTRAPAIARALATVFGAAPARTPGGEEAVALGAALLAAVLDGRADDVAIVDRAPRTVGLRGAEDRHVPVIRRGAALPARVRKTFATGDGRRRIGFELYEGEDAIATQNRRVARVRLGEPAGAGRGEHVEVVFTVDASGCLAVAARDPRTGEPWTVELG